MKRLATIAAIMIACIITIPCAAESNKLLLGLSYRQIENPGFSNKTFKSDEFGFSAQEFDLLDDELMDAALAARLKADSFGALSWHNVVAIAIQRLNWNELSWDQWDPQASLIDLEAVDDDASSLEATPAYLRLLSKFEDEDEGEYLSKVRYNTEVRQVRFIGIHRYWIKPTRRALFQKVMGPDRQAFMDRDSMPGRAAAEYRRMVRDMGWDMRRDTTNIRTPWNSKGRGRVEVYGRRENYAEWGPLVINSRGRVRIDITELTGLDRLLSSWYLRSRSRRRSSRGSASFDPNAVRVGGDHTRLLRFRMNLSGSMSTTTGISSISFRVRTVWAPTRKRSTTLPISMKVSYDLDDGDMKTSFRVRLLSF